MLDWLKFAFEIAAAAIGATAAAVSVAWSVRGYIEKGFKKNRKIFYKALKEHDDKNDKRHTENVQRMNDFSSRLGALEGSTNARRR